MKNTLAHLGLWAYALLSVALLLLIWPFAVAFIAIAAGLFVICLLIEGIVKVANNAKRGP